IVGLLPFGMFAVLFVVNQPYLMSLINDPRGLVLLAGGLGCQFIGVMVMRSMSRFEI
ncbi:MAG: pilus assembly protein TadB, partial [Rhodospirillaceae bacterium]|nr:pilus assembly protein TadB [Rhodospirillaceae bacterium]